MELHRRLTIDQAVIELGTIQVEGDTIKVVRVEALREDPVEFWLEENDLDHLARFFTSAAG